MHQILLRIRPAAVMEDLNLEIIRARAQRLTNWQADLQDTRLSDAPYVTVIAKIPQLDAAAVAELKRAFARLPRMRAQVWQRVGEETPLQRANLTVLTEASQTLQQHLNRGVD
jgi:hypothetical protein